MKKLMIVLTVLACVLGLGVVQAQAAVTTNDATVGGPSFNAADKGKDYVVERTVSLATYQCASNDCVQVFYLPSNSVVRFVQYDVIATNSTSSAVQTFDIGDATYKGRFVESGSMASVNARCTPQSNHLYTAATYIRFTPTDAMSSGSIRIRLGATDCSK